jgi:hypothetical protein
VVIAQQQVSGIGFQVTLKASQMQRLTTEKRKEQIKDDQPFFGKPKQINSGTPTLRSAFASLRMTSSSVASG